MENDHCVRTMHAEANAIVQAARNGVRIDEAAIYITASPCWPCFKMIANAGLRRIVFGEFYRDDRIFKFAKDGKLKAGDMQGGTFSISSLGGIGGTYFTPIINAPEVAILGVSKSAHKPVWDGKAFAPRLMVPLSLSYDHRVIDGASAARFTAYLAGMLADMRRVVL